MWIEGVRGHELADSRTPIRNAPIRNPRDPWRLARERPAGTGSGRRPQAWGLRSGSPARADARP
eukprot:1963986-Alexandrium_andersonii.AAC.1